MKMCFPATSNPGALNLLAKDYETNKSTGLNATVVLFVPVLQAQRYKVKIPTKVPYEKECLTQNYDL